MGTSVSQLRFAAEFVVFIISLAGLILSFRPEVIDRDASTRTLFGAGVLALGAAAFMHGAFLVTDFDQPTLVALRLFGLVLLALGTIRWRAAGLARPLLWIAILLLLGGELAVRGNAERLGDWLRLAGGLVAGVALVRAARHSIPARIGTIVASLLLTVVLAVSVALSLVIDRNVVDSAFARYKSRASSEVAAAQSESGKDLFTAKILAGTLAAGDAGNRIEQLLKDPNNPLLKAQLKNDLTNFAGYVGVQEPILYVTPRRAPLAFVGDGLDTTTALSLAGSKVVVDALADAATGVGRQSVVLVPGGAYAIAARPIPQRSGMPGPLGAIVVAEPLDQGYLQRRLLTAGEPLSLALVDTTSVLAVAGAQPPTSVLVGEAKAAIQRGTRGSRTANSRFVVSSPINGSDGSSQVALVLSAPTSAIDATRRELFRSLFLVAMGVTLVAMVLAVFSGERIGGGLRRLTAAATRIRSGELGARSGLVSPDELGVLADAFDSMAGSLETMTDDLRRSADDEARLRARLQAVVEGMGEALLAVDRAGNVTECNPAAEALLGVTRDAVLGRPIDEVVPVVEGLHPVVAGDTGVRAGESLVRTAHGPEVPVALSVGPLLDVDGSSAGAVVVLRDLRREREIDQLKTDFLSNISHELRTPLTPIKGYADILATRKLKEEQTVRFAQEITGGVAQLERVIGQLVNFATVAAGRLDLAPQEVPATEIVTAALDRWRPRAPAGHKLTRRIARGTPAAVVDRVAIGQALDELLDNALKYSPGGGRIVVSAHADPGPADGDPAGNGGSSSWVRVSVADQGVGVRPDRLAEVLTEFSQGDGSATRRFSGLGLGLALVDRIVRAHGGWVEVDSIPERGSVFSIVVPAAAPRPARVRRA